MITFDILSSLKRIYILKNQDTHVNMPPNLTQHEASSFKHKQSTVLQIYKQKSTSLTDKVHLEKAEPTLSQVYNLINSKFTLMSSELSKGLTNIKTDILNLKDDISYLKENSEHDSLRIDINQDKKYSIVEIAQFGTR